MSGATPKSFVIIRFLLTVLLCSASPALSVDFSCGEGPTAIHNVTATPSTVYQLEGREILLVPGGQKSSFFFWRRRTRNSNSTAIPQTDRAFRFELPNLRILSMSSDLDGTQFSYGTSMEERSDLIFTSNWTTTIIGYPPTITGVPSETTFIEGQMKKTITFNNSGTPNPDITCWNESSTQVFDHARFSCTSGRLVFGPLFESDEGQYTVKSVNCFGSNTTQMNIIVNRGPTISGNFTTRIVECGGGVNVSYSIDGDPAPDFQWYFKGSPYNSAIQPTSSQLIIRNVTFENTGVYTLKVNNSAGEKNVSFRLLLNEPSDELLRFTQKASLSIPGQLGCMQPFNVTCVANGSNLQSINWNKHINSSGPFDQKTIEYCKEQEIHSTLRFSNGLSQSGQYHFSCQAKSTSLKSVTSSTFVQVLCPLTVKLTCDHCTSCTVGTQCPVGLTAEIHLAKEGEQPRFHDVPDLCTGQMVNHSFYNLTSLTLYTVTATVKNDSLNQNQVSTAKATTPECLSSESFPTAIVASVTVVTVIVLIIAIVVGILKYRSVKQKAIAGSTNETGGMKLGSRRNHEGVPHDAHVEEVHYAASGPDAKTEDEQRKTHATSSGANKYEEQPEAYATSAIAKGATASGAKQQQPNKGKNGASKNIQTGPSGETYALPDMAKKKKKGDTVQVPTGQYAKVDKDKRHQKQGLHYADLDKDQMKGSTNPRSSQSVTYSDVKEVQPPPKAE